jgi:hypothetical protein
MTSQKRSCLIASVVFGVWLGPMLGHLLWLLIYVTSHSAATLPTDGPGILITLVGIPIGAILNLTLIAALLRTRWCGRVVVAQGLFVVIWLLIGALMAAIRG